MKSILSLWTALMCLFCLCESMDRFRNKICYSAKTCIHSGKEKCGKNSRGSIRRFYDSCDILEFNCLKGTDYVKTSFSDCHNLPPIDDKNQNHDNRFPSNADGNINENAETGIAGEIVIDDDEIQGDININDGNFEEKGAGTQGGTGADKNEPGIEGEIIIDDDGIAGEININDGESDLAPGEAASNAEETALEGEIDINDDEITGEVKINQDLVPAGDSPNADKTAIEGAIEISDDEIRGDVKINDDLDAPPGGGGSSYINKHKNQGLAPAENSPYADKTAIEGAIEISDDEIRGDVKINDDLDAPPGGGGSSYIKKHKNQGVAPAKKSPNADETAIEGAIEISDDEIRGDVKINDDLDAPSGGAGSSNINEPSEEQSSIAEGPLVGGAVEGEIELDDEEIKGDITINQDLNAENEENTQEEAAPRDDESIEAAPITHLERNNYE